MSLSKFAIAFFVISCASRSFAQGILSNGENVTGTITNGSQTVSWTFGATAGAAILLGIQETTDTNFSPSITLLAPDGTRLGYQSGSYSATVSATASSMGTYTVIVGSSTGGTFSA